MKLACYQGASPAGDVSAGLRAVDRALGRAAGMGADMLVMPEVFLPGYASFDGAFDTQAALNAVRALVRGHGLALTIGMAETTGAGTFNTAFALGPDGALLATHRKVQLFGPQERRLYEPGEALTAFSYRGHRFGLLICYDVEFPEHTRALAQAGCQTILVPTANMEPYASVNLALIPARAQESALNIAYANYCGREGPLTYVGRSLIAGRDGPPIACCGTGEALLLADLSELSLASASLSSQLDDLRPALPVSWAQPET